MKATTRCLLSVSLCAVALGAAGLLAPLPGVDAGPPKGAHKWQYGILNYYLPQGEGNRSLANWIAGKTAVAGSSKKFYYEALMKVYNDLGGKEDADTFNRAIALL